MPYSNKCWWWKTLENSTKNYIGDKQWWSQIRNHYWHNALANVYHSSYLYWQHLYLFMMHTFTLSHVRVSDSLAFAKLIPQGEAHWIEIINPCSAYNLYYLVPPWGIGSGNMRLNHHGLTRQDITTTAFIYKFNQL